LRDALSLQGLDDVSDRNVVPLLQPPAYKASAATVPGQLLSNIVWLRKTMFSQMSEILTGPTAGLKSPGWTSAMQADPSERRQWNNDRGARLH
jgi:hypothetical protein